MEKYEKMFCVVTITAVVVFLGFCLITANHGTDVFLAKASMFEATTSQDIGKAKESQEKVNADRQKIVEERQPEDYKIFLASQATTTAEVQTSVTVAQPVVEETSSKMFVNDYVACYQERGEWADCN